MEAAFVFIALFTGVFGVIYYHLYSRHRERMSLIEHGADAKLFQNGSKRRPYFFAMLLGILFVCLAAGIGVGYAIDMNMVRYRGENPVPYFISISLFLGLGFIVSYFIHKRELMKEE